MPDGAADQRHGGGHIPGLAGLRARDVVRRTVADFLRDDLLTYAAALSYHLIFALFPFLLFLLALLSFLDLSQLFDYLLEQSRAALPPRAAEQVAQVIGEVAGRNRGGLLSFGILATVWFASVGMRSTMNALNRAYDLEEGRSIGRRYALSLAYTVVFAVLVVLATLLFVFGPQLTAWAASSLGLGQAVLAAWEWLRTPAALLLAVTAVSVVYHFAPNLQQRFRLVTPGSVVAVALWALVSVLFRLYVANFGRYSVTYGSVGAVIMLLFYFFLSGTVLLLGGELNAVVRRARRGSQPRK